jgi:hypothetical protein
MKKTNSNLERHRRLGKISTSTRGEIKGVIEFAGLHTPAINLS